MAEWGSSKWLSEDDLTLDLLHDAVAWLEGYAPGANATRNLRRAVSLLEEGQQAAEAILPLLTRLTRAIENGGPGAHIVAREDIVPLLSPPLVASDDAEAASALLRRLAVLAGEAEEIRRRLDCLGTTPLRCEAARSGGRPKARQEPEPGPEIAGECVAIFRCALCGAEQEELVSHGAEIRHGGIRLHVADTPVNGWVDLVDRGLRAHVCPDGRFGLLSPVGVRRVRLPAGG